MINIREKLREYRRVLIVASKPGKDDFVSAAKICAAGIALIGVIGFAIFLAFLFAGF